MQGTAGIKSYRDLLVWQKAMDLVAEVYEITKRLPAQETYGLASQMHRAAVSIPANIAEGYGRQHRREYLQHLSFANGSLKEVETHVLITVRLGFLKEQDVAHLLESADNLGRMLNTLMRRLRAGSS